MLVGCTQHTVSVSPCAEGEKQAVTLVHKRLYRKRYKFPNSIDEVWSDTGDNSMLAMQTLVVMRHAKRLDEVDPTFASTSESWWDPPLTPEGHQQVGRSHFESISTPTG